MQFELRVNDRLPDLAAIEFVIGAMDPAVLLDLDAARQTIRISTSVTETELLACLKLAGAPTAPERLTRIPSQCCGGCGG